MKQALAIRSDFSVGESLLQLDKLVDQAKALGYEALALTDTCSIHAMPDFTAKCVKAGIKPIVGVTLKVHDDAEYRKVPDGPKNSPHIRLKVYVLDERGLKWLFGAMSKAGSKGRYYYHPRTSWDDFVGAEGIAVATGDFFGLFSHDKYEERLKFLIESLGPENVYLELSPVDTPLFDRMNSRAIETHHASEPGKVPQLMLSYPFLSPDASSASSLNILGMVTSGGKVGERWHPIQYVREFHMQPPDHIKARIKATAARLAKFNGNTSVGHWVSAMVGTEELVDRVSYKFEKMPVSLPTMAPDEFAKLVAECKAGWARRFAAPVLGHKPSDAELNGVYKDRLKYELGVLRKMGFSGYFLLAQDIVKWSKDNGIIVGPGRGSVGGSLVAYLLHITDVDPLRFNLLFERFINPDRIDLPDADLDFMSSRRHEVIEYLRDKYGHDRVAGISNYSTMAAASAIRDAGRVFGLSPLDLAPTKLVPKEHGQPVSLTQAVAQVPELEAFAATHREVWAHALAFEGGMRALSQHAAGVVVGGEPLVSRAVVEDREGSPVVCWDKRTVEDFGLVKLDILGLSTLDVLAIAKEYIKERHGKTVDYLALPLDDAAVMDAFGRGDTTGVFQFESKGMRELLSNLAKGGALTFEDIAAATALYRPGPMDSGLLDDFVAIKQGHRAPTYEHPLMEPALKDTYSVIVYQEQVMQVAVDLAGFTRTEADHLRKAMGKKDKVKMAEMRQKWIDGCFKTAGMGDIPAGLLFDKIEAFAGYGFNKSHAVEYSIISYWTMWLRVNYPAEYFAACLSIVGEDKLTGLVKDAREVGIELLPPDINISNHRFQIDPSGNAIVAPFNAVLGISETTARRIAEMRGEAGGRFATIKEFTDMAGQKGSKVNSRVVERLDKVGALASLDATQKPPRHPDRRRDQTELMPGLIIDVVKADRYTEMDGTTKARIIHIVQDYSKCNACDLAGSAHPVVRIPKSKAKFMVVTDCPSWQEEKGNKLLIGDGAQALMDAIALAGLNVGEGYYTTLVKARKNDKFLSSGQINGCKQFLEQELDLIKPAVVVALGSASIKHFLPDTKGGTADLAGKAVFNPKLNMSVVCGINPAQVAFDPSKASSIEDTFRKVAEIVS